MRSWFMLQRWRLRTKMLAVSKGLVRAVRIRLLQLQPAERLAYALPLIVLAVSQAGCAMTSAPPANTPANPTPPPSALPASPPNYSERAAADIQIWRSKLTEQIQKPAN